MDDRLRAARFEQELKLLMEEDQSVLRQEYPREFKSVLQVAEICLKTNFSTESQVRTRLLDTLLTKFQKRDTLSDFGLTEKSDTAGEYEEDQEFTELDLSRIVGGMTAPSVGGCVLCECDISSESISGEKCPACGHDRAVHR
jgi:hypothetical protein